MSAAPEPVAIVGIGCRFAGGVGCADDLWQLLLAGTVTAAEVPAGRWQSYAEHSREYAAALERVPATGSFLADVAGFDASFFGISGAEASQLDPQQRMALEVSWEALEDAGIPAAGLAGSDTGVYFGVGTDDYGRRLLEDLPRVQAWTGIGASLCGVPNRVSHALDLRGPSVAIDTACSSSLVAVHSASTALRAGECRIALAGGVMLMSGPGLTAVLGEAGALGRDGRSKPFDAGADGYGRGEGCAVVVLKLLSLARADGDEVLAVIRGGAVRQDGRTEGIMAPSGTAQQDLLRAAYAAAGVDPAAVGYVEAHGTGTPAGDPLEARALCAAFARPKGRPVCRVGSVKANIGHTEAAAGVAGLIKTVLVLRNRWIPATPIPGTPRADVPWQQSGVLPATHPTPWADPGQPRLAGVASYGYGGTIAHLVLEEGDPQWTSEGDRDGRGTVPSDTQFALSAASREALVEQARTLIARLNAPHAPALADIAVTLAGGRTHLRHRAVVTTTERAGLVRGLRLLTEGAADGSLCTGTAADDGVVLVFSGHGAQWAGMGRGLLDVDPVFTATLDRLAPVYAAELGATPRELITAADLGGVDRIQAALCAVQLGLAAHWHASGVRPAAVIGHSVGEIAAAVTAGALSEQDAARLVCRRSALLTLVAGQGAMLLVDLGFADCAAALRDLPGASAAIAAAPESTVVAGDVAGVEAARRLFTDAGRTVRSIDSDVAFHTAQMAPLAAELAVAVAGLRPRPPQTALYTTALDDPRGAHLQDGSYWAANLRNPVRFTQAIAAAIEDGHRTFLEVSAHPVVAHSITETLAAHHIDNGSVIPSLRRHRDETAQLAAGVAALHCRGIPVRLRTPAGRRVRLPGVAWRHTGFWSRHPVPAPPGPAHTLLGAPIDTHGSAAVVWPTTVHARTRPYPGSHPVLGTEIVPAAVTLLTYLAAAESAGLADVRLYRPIVVPEQDQPDRELQVIREGDSLRIASRLPGGEFVAHSAATAQRDVVFDAAADLLDPSAADRPLDAGSVPERLARLGVAAMGFPWRVDKLTSGDGVLVAEVAADPQRQLRHADWASLLDAALSTASVVFDGEPTLRMPAALAELTMSGASAPERAVVVAAVDRQREFTVHVDVRGENGEPLLRLRGLRYAEPDGLGTDGAVLGETVFDVRWTEIPDPVAAPSGAIVFAEHDSGVESGLAAALAAAASAHQPVDPRQPTHLLVPAGADPAATVLAVTAAVRDALDRPGRKVWVVTRGVADGAGASGSAAAAGLGRVLATEHPETFGGVLDLPWDEPCDTVLAALRGRLANPGTEPVVALREGVCLAPRAVPLGSVVPAEPTITAPVCRAEGSYLITGGLGALGLTVAAHLAQRGARRLVLLGRSPLPVRGSAEDDPRVRAVRAIEAAGATVFPVAADITDPVAVRAALGGLDIPPIRGVLHAAGSVRSGAAEHLSTTDLEEVLAAKVAGARTLEEMFAPGSLDFLVLFSSAGPLLGLPGQAAYAAANACLDGMAAARRAAGDTGCVSIAWTSWRGLGMATSAAATDVELDARGTTDLAPQAALTALDRVLAARHDLDRGPVAVLGVRAEHAGTRPALLADLAIEGASSAETRSWRQLRGRELTKELRACVTECVAAVLGTPPESVHFGLALGEQGIDSLLGATLRVRLERNTGVALAPTLLWNHPTVEAITTHLAHRLQQGEAAEQEDPTDDRDHADLDRTPVRG